MLLAIAGRQRLPEQRPSRLGDAGLEQVERTGAGGWARWCPQRAATDSSDMRA